MISYEYYTIELDIESFYKTASGIFIDKEGSIGEVLPLHGIIKDVPINGKFSKGDTAYFHHFKLKEIPLDARKRDKLEIRLKEGEMISVNRDGQWIQASLIPATKIKKERSKFMEFEYGDKYETQKFKLSNGDTVWVFKDSDYLIEYLPEVAFLREEFIIYNETQDTTHNGYVILRDTDSAKDLEKVGNLLLPSKFVRQRGKAEVVKDSVYGLKGKVNYLKTTGSKLQIDGLSVSHINEIQGCLI
jgi:hypothetical protein